MSKSLSRMFSCSVFAAIALKLGVWDIFIVVGVVSLVVMFITDDLQDIKEKLS